MPQPRFPRLTVSAEASLCAPVCVAWAGAVYAAPPATASQAAQQVSKEPAAHPKACAPPVGVPICGKDNIEVAGVPNTAGTPALKGYVLGADARAVCSPP